MINITIQCPEKHEVKIRPIAVAVLLLLIFFISEQFSIVSSPKVPTRPVLEFGEEAEECLFNSKKKKNNLTETTTATTTSLLVPTSSSSSSSSLSSTTSSMPIIPPTVPAATQLLINPKTFKSKKQQKQQQTLHILQGLMGNHKPFIAEWEVCLKSLLMNAPLDAPMHIHYVADSTATEAIKEIMEVKAKLKDSLWRTSITISVYTISQEINQVWKEFLLQKVRGKDMDTRISLGGYYRVLAYNMIVDHYYNRTAVPTTVNITTNNNNNGTESRTINIRMPQQNIITTSENSFLSDDGDHPPLCAIYMDVDVAILANMNPLLQQIDCSKYLMQAAMSKGLNSGLLMINLSQFDEFWDLVDTLPNLKFGGDQYLITEVTKHYPERVGRITLPWDVHLGHGWKSRPHELLEQQPEGVDMLHFAALRSNRVSYFNENKEQGIDYMCHREASCQGNETRLEQFRSSWGLIEYFVRIPWSWVVHQYGENKLPIITKKGGGEDDGSGIDSEDDNDDDDDTEEGLHGFPLRIEYVIV